MTDILRCGRCGGNYELWLDATWNIDCENYWLEEDDPNYCDNGGDVAGSSEAEAVKEWNEAQQDEIS